VTLGVDSITLHGALLVDKPAGPTSHDLVGFTRRLLQTKRVGHTGTLDPLATGLLVMLVGHATRLSQFLVTDTKEYIADIRLGVATRTYDAASLDQVDIRYPIADSRYPTDAEIDAALDHFRGSFLQTPPPYSAKKIGGVKAYEMARKNEAVELQPVEVTVHELERLEPRTADLGPRTSDLEPWTSDIGYRLSDIRDPTLLRVRVAASSGFYVRSLAHDLGQVLGCGAHLEALRRTRVGRFRLEDAATVDTLVSLGPQAAGRLVTMNALLPEYPAVSLTDEGLRRACNGNALGPQHLVEVSGQTGGGSDARVRVLGPDGELLSVAEQRPDGSLHPLLVLR